MHNILNLANLSVIINISQVTVLPLVAIPNFTIIPDANYILLEL